MSRGVSSVVGVVLFVGLTVVLAATVGAVVAVDGPETVPSARLTLTADAATDRITLTHEGGETLAVDALDCTVRIDGTPLVHQPPIPFFAARGFESGPTGPFNPASEGTWSAGETASFRLATTNHPRLSTNTRVEVTIATESGVVARLETTPGRG